MYCVYACVTQIEDRPLYALNYFTVKTNIKRGSYTLTNSVRPLQVRGNYSNREVQKSPKYV